ncbi:hypothetical protein [Stenotrophomonas sp. AS1]|uniref:hypothetical protein n=1 Tax=Stenotrophomonas sp. AS1 TaxID=3029188 RepID=UPI003B783349
MATFEITAPDGSVFEITAPDDATEEQVLAYAQQQFSGQTETPAEQPAAAPAEILDPTEGMSGYEKFMAGMGKSVNDTWNGLRQVGGAIGDAIPGVDLTDWRAGVQADIDESRALDAPLMNTGWGTAGNITGQVAQVAIPVGGVAGRATTLLGRAAPYAGAAARGGAFSGAQPVSGDESRLTNALLGAGSGVAGQGIAAGLGTVANRARNALSPAVQRSIEAAQHAGIPLRAAQVSDSQFLKTVQSAMDAVPLSGAGGMARRQQEAFNRAVGRTFGADEAYLDDAVMAGARQRIGQTYNDVYARNNITLDDEAIRRMLEIEGRAATNLTPDNAQVVRNQVQRVLDAFEDGQVPGARYQNLRGDLADVMDGSATGRLVRALRGEVDASAARSVGGADAEALRQANAQWANMRTAESALQQVAGAGGNIRPASLYPLVRNGSTGEMRELAQIGQNVLKDPIANSGTAQRELVYSMLGLGGGGFLASRDNPWLQAAGAGLLAGRALNSPVLARTIQAARPVNQAALTGLARVSQAAPYVLPPAANLATAPLSIDVVGGRVGAAPTVEELEALRRRGPTP